MLQSPHPVPVLPAAGRRFHAMAKPVSSACNLDCAYCYHLSKERLSRVGSGRMPPEELAGQVVEALSGWAGTSSLADDVSIVAVEWLPAAADSKGA